MFALIFILGMSLKMMMLPVLLLKAAGRDSVIALTVILLSELVCLVAIVAAVVLSPGLSFPELLRGFAGKWTSKIVCMLFSLFFVFKLVLLSGEVRIFFSENLFDDFHWGAYALPFFALITVFGMGTARALGRTAQFLLPFIFIATVLMLVLIGGGVDFTEVLPFGEFGVRNTLSETVRYAMWYGDYSALIVFLGSVKRSKFTVSASIVSGAVASAVVLFFTLGLTASFSNVCNVIRFGQNVTGMSHYALGNVMEGRFDLLMFCVWMISVFVKAGIFSYTSVYFFRSAVPLKAPAVSLALGVILYFVSMLTPSATGLHTFMMNVFAVPALVLQFLIPAFMLTVALAGRKKQFKRDDRKYSVADSDKGDGDETQP